MAKPSIVAALLGVLLAPAAAAEPSAPVLHLRADATAEERVFDWERDRCERWDIPDAPARAFRDADGEVHLIAGNHRNRRASGPTLDAVDHRCAPIYEAGGVDEPGAYDDRGWIASLFTRDGVRVEALVHMEYHGHRRPARCPAGDYMACWRNALVGVVSTDAGRSFRVPAAGPRAVAALPYRYTGTAGERTGYFNPSNMLRFDGHLYVYVYAEDLGAQARGVCLLRRPVDGGNADWRAFDGEGFDVAFADPYDEAPPRPQRHVCTPLAGVTATLSTVVRHEPSGRFVAVSPMTARDADGRPRSGVYWRESADLVHWSAPRLLLEAPLLWRHDCGEETVIAYPSLLDPKSASRHFDRIGDRVWLYLVRMRLHGCRASPDRDLVRLPVRVVDHVD